MTWRDRVDAWNQLDRRHPTLWWSGVAILILGAGGAAVTYRQLRALSPLAFPVVAGLLAVLLLAVGGRLFWNGRERRVRALFRIVLMNGLVALLFVGGRYAGLPLSRKAMFAGGSVSMAAGSLCVAVIFSVAAVVAVWLLGRRPIRELGIVPGPGWWGDLSFGLWLGVLLMTMVFGIEYAAGWLRVRDVAWTAPPDSSFPFALLNMTIVFLTVGYYEELSSRGYLLRELAQGFAGRLIPASWAIVIATLLSSAAFGLGHLGNPNATWVSTINIVLAGVVLALPYILTGRLAGSIGLHITWNLFQGCIYGLPVSGMVAPVSVLHIEQLGPASWTGGPFGPEAGLLGVLAMAMGAALIIGRERGRRGRATLYTGLVEPRVPTLAA
jgi:membrane protease YdiL (CAAX protease family)